MPKILIADPIASEGVDLLRSRAEVDVKVGMKPDELLGVIGEYQALVVRSETKVTAEVIKAGKELTVIARAGIGVDNIDLDAATTAGIAVVNAPTGNTVASWIKARRLKQCYDALADPHKPIRSIAELAYRWGFSDQAHFSRSFKTRYNMTPGQVRAQALVSKK